MMLNMSLANVANELGLTLQQIQKYEKGTNRIGASRIQQIADVLRVPVPALFDGASSAAHDPPKRERFGDKIMRFL